MGRSWGRTAIVFSVVLVFLAAGIAIYRQVSENSTIARFPQGAVIDPQKAGDVPEWASRLPAPTAVRIISPGKRSDLISMPWRFVSIDSGATSLNVLYVAGDGSCITPVGFEVEETASYVEVWAWSRSNGALACGGGAVRAAGIVNLPEPIGTRALIHAQVDPAWRSPGFLAD